MEVYYSIMDNLMDIIVIAESPFLPILISMSMFWAILLCSLWHWRQGNKRTQALVDRIRAVHAQAGSRPRHLPSLASCYRLFPESTNWVFRLDRELNALERQHGVRVPYSQRRLSLSSSEDALNRFTRRVEALEGFQRR